MANSANLKNEYAERIIPALTKEFGYSSVMQVPALKKIVINQGLGLAVADKKVIETAITELTTITGQKAVATLSKKRYFKF
jgi:large subunit ribosomal protein L5